MLRPGAAQLLKLPAWVWALDVYVLPPLFFEFMFVGDSDLFGDHADNCTPPAIWEWRNSFYDCIRLCRVSGGLSFIVLFCEVGRPVR